MPSIRVNPTVVKFGQTAFVTITGTPGATVDLFTRRFPQTTFTKIRDGLVLDRNGRVVVPTKPDVNLRFMAKDRTVAQGSNVGATNGLMTVEKQVSLNVRRVGVRRFTFTGSINPMHPRAVVQLRRNGVVIKSGIPVNRSRVYSFTATLPRGTYDFRIVSPSTGYNAISFSPIRRIRIF